MEAESKILEEHLREAACIGDYDTVTGLIRAGVNINSQNNMNGWTALHWAAKRNHKEIVQLLIRNGANRQTLDNKGQSPANVTSDNEIQSILGEIAPVTTPVLPFTPSYLKYPALPICKSLQIGRAFPTPNRKHNVNDKLVLKVRVAGLDPDFIEVELCKAELTFKELVEVCCKELEVESEKVKKIRKIPNTIIRKDGDIERLSDYQEIELCCS